VGHPGRLSAAYAYYCYSHVFYAQKPLLRTADHPHYPPINVSAHSVSVLPADLETSHQTIHTTPLSQLPTVDFTNRLTIDAAAYYDDNYNCMSDLELCSYTSHLNEDSNLWGHQHLQETYNRQPRSHALEDSPIQKMSADEGSLFHLTPAYDKELDVDR
jgi:hypothetical protein